MKFSKKLKASNLKIFIKIVEIYIFLFLLFIFKVDGILAFDDFYEPTSLEIVDFIDNQYKILNVGKWGSYLVKQENFSTYHIYSQQNSCTKVICKIILKNTEKYFIEIPQDEKPIDGFYIWEANLCKVGEETCWVISPQNDDYVPRKIYIKNLRKNGICSVMFSNEMVDMDGCTIKEEVFSAYVSVKTYGEILDISSFWLSMLWIRFVGLTCI